MQEIKSLLERAKPEFLEALAQHKIGYASLTERVEEVLNRTYWVVDIPYGVMVEIRSACLGVKLNFDINNPWALFEENKMV